MKGLNLITMLLLIIGGINWALIGIANINLVALIFGFAPIVTALVYILIGIAVLAVLELNALGMISGRGNTGLNVIYETHKNAMYTGFALIVGFYILAEILLRV